SAAGHDATGRQVSINPSNGDAVVVWQRFDGSNIRVQPRVGTAGGTWSATQTLSAAGHDATDPQVGVDPAGGVVVVWRRADGTNQRVQARVRTTGGGWGVPEDLSATGETAAGPQVGVEDGGTVV